MQIAVLKTSPTSRQGSFDSGDMLMTMMRMIDYRDHDDGDDGVFDGGGKRGGQGAGDRGGGITFDEVPDCEACPAECLKNQYFIENFRNVKTRSRISWIIH